MSEVDNYLHWEEYSEYVKTSPEYATTRKVIEEMTQDLVYRALYTIYLLESTWEDSSLENGRCIK